MGRSNLSLGEYPSPAYASAVSSGQSWGRVFHPSQQILPVGWRHEPLRFDAISTSVLPYGRGRSYGDSCLNDGGTLLATRRLDRFIDFHSETGVLRCEGGVRLDAILRTFVPKGFFIPITLGTKLISVGGAIANDVHGKNHHCAGTFGRHVLRFELLRSDGRRVVCSPTDNTDLFQATVAGLGLTGLILWADIRLQKITGPMVSAESIRFESLDEFLELSDSSNRDYEHSAAWADLLASRRVRGLFMRGNFSEGDGAKRKSRFRIKIPMNAPNFLLNRWTMKTFNALYFERQTRKVARQVLSYDPFFFPLDSIRRWNRMYGKRGFFQYQCVVPEQDRTASLPVLLDRARRSGSGPFLVVMKTFGDLRSPGMLSFPLKGVTVSLDFPNDGAVTRKTMDDLDAIVQESGGAVYPAKDARMSPEHFKAYFPRWREFSAFIDPKFSSSFWRRVTGEVS
ncbi:MAG TPA: FAD-binding oxidoreductase [Bdellovibrionota bacterium]|nr:FAD-binding oxidoreductase [Bdellovibrionota bacterium]